MSIEQWSDNVLLVKLADDPQFSDELNTLLEQCQQQKTLDVVLDFSDVSYLNSSNIALLLRLRKCVVVNNQRRLKLCCINSQVWGVFLVTGLDRLFDVVEDVPSALASLQMQQDSADSPERPSA